jgi:hypothetical protein
MNFWMQFQYLEVKSTLSSCVLFVEIWGLISDAGLAEVANLHRFLIGSGNDGLMIDAGLSASCVMPPFNC